MIVYSLKNTTKYKYVSHNIKNVEFNITVKYRIYLGRIKGTKFVSLHLALTNFSLTNFFHKTKKKQ